MNKYFDEDVQATLGAAFNDKMFMYKGNHFKFQIWDTAGQERYGPLAQMYYRDANVAILVYDTTSKESFAAMKAWHGELTEKGPKNMVLAIVGNKTELVEYGEVSPKVAEKYAQKNNALFKLTSAKENQGISELFDSIVEEVLETSVLEETSDMNASKLGKPKQGGEEGKSRRCCA